MALSDHLRELRARIIRVDPGPAGRRSSSRCSSTTTYPADPAPLPRGGGPLPLTTRPRPVLNGVDRWSDVGEPVRPRRAGWCPRRTGSIRVRHRPGAAPERAGSGQRIFAAIAGPLFSPASPSATTSCRRRSRPYRVHPGERDQPGRVHPVLLLHQPDAADLRYRFRDPAVRDHAEPGRRRLREAAGWIPALDHHRHLRLRRRRHALTDPFSMLFLAIPMLVLFLIAEIIARLVDRARGRGGGLPPTSGQRRRGLHAVTYPAPSTPFDLPDWLGDGPVTWATDRGLDGFLVRRLLHGGRGRDPRLRPAGRQPGLSGAGAGRHGPHPQWDGPGGTARCCCSPARDGRPSPLPAPRGTPTRVLDAFTRVARGRGLRPGALVGGGSGWRADRERAARRQ